MKTPALLILPLVGLLLACDKETQPAAELPTILKLQVTDAAGQPLPNTPVTLYNSQLDWAKELNPVQTTTTTATGEAQFSWVTKPEYFVDIANGNVSNWESGYRVNGIQQEQLNQATIVLREYRSRLISRAAGKVWHLVQFKLNGTDLTNHPDYQCFTDNRWIFYKGPTSGRFELDEGTTKCDPADPQTTSGTWQILNNGTTLELPEDGAVVSYNLEYLSATTLRFNRQVGTDNYSYILQTQ